MDMMGHIAGIKAIVVGK